MIKFFRKIRQNLLMENKTGKYFKYAIGEIVLVVIGILIALQINNWNNEQNRIKSETIILKQLISDLTKSQAELKKYEEAMVERAKACVIVCHAFYKEDIPNDSIYVYMRKPLGTEIYSPTLGTARSIINSGNISLIKSDDLKNKITAYVEIVEYKLKNINRYEETYFRNGMMLLKEVMQITNLFPKSDLLNLAVSDSILISRNDKLNIMPSVIEKIPFEKDLKELYQNYKVFSAYNSLLISHRNSAYVYNDIFEITNELLEELEEISTERD
tara:strand:+ start:115 stop:930 length:816 start_codon:yes stop_codon:yes gene_type:complete